MLLAFVAVPDKAAVIVPALKFPLAFRNTILLAVFAVTAAIVAEFSWSSILDAVPTTLPVNPTLLILPRTKPEVTNVITSPAAPGNPVPLPSPIPVPVPFFSFGASIKLVYTQRDDIALVSSVPPAPPTLPYILFCWNVLSVGAIAMSPTLMLPPVFSCGLVSPLAVKIVPCPGVLSDSVPDDSDNTSYVLVPPIISAVA